VVLSDGKWIIAILSDGCRTALFYLRLKTKLARGKKKVFQASSDWKDQFKIESSKEV